ncbi:C40 family peptidase [Nocardioides mesophilus]|uniref:C40 family peptidase n=1 Tax=Nocardioides mesophilus TaxID=433659 RepID=A0A7G9RBE6_9ACTN|nr:C40 family peptidase [Nocardioides mesophilus]QNN52921.1 C40 family peptidase [Nocardioides mesophilus]
MSRHPLHGHPDLREVSVPVATMWTGPDAPRDLDEAAVRDRPDAAEWVAVLDAEGTPERRLGLHGRTLTQLLLGDAALVLEERDDWVRVAAIGQSSSAHARGYPGWVRRSHLGAPVDRTAGATAFVVVAAAPLLSADGATTALSCGTALGVLAVAGQEVEVLLPGGTSGMLPRSAVRLGHEQQQPAYGPDDLLATARQFLGVRYLWGGTSGWGLDCSGLVHLTLRTHGVLVPRDAFDQAAATRDVLPVPLDEVRPGDLYFFARPGERVYHVGFVTRPVGDDGSRWMLHAPEGGAGSIEDAPMTSDRVEKLVAAGRVLKPDAGQLATY